MLRCQIAIDANSFMEIPVWRIPQAVRGNMGGVGTVLPRYVALVVR